MDEMDYTQFIAYLKSEDIEFDEETGVDIEFWFCEYVKVIPDSKRLKIRYFSEDGGHQLH